MANNRSQISYGSQGDDVKELQRLLNANGYSLDVDGIWGDNTEDAVRKYQKQNGLTVDGIVGTNTWGSLYGTNASGSTTTPSTSKNYSDIDLTEYNSGYQKSDDVLSAEKKKADADNAVANYGDFSYSNQGQFDEIMNKILNREAFSYDLNGDALYQQYKDKYIEQGKMAMADTIGQASAMTGGYGNSYAATVGNQAYQASLSQLNDIIPELYQMAYSRYNQEGQDMLNTLGMLNTEYDKEYGVYTDQYGRLVTDRDYYNTAYNNQFNRDYGMYDSDRTLAHSEHTNEEGYNYNNYRDKVEDEQWQKTYDLSERELQMAEEAWELEKKQANNTVKVNNTTKDDDKPKEAPIKATETKATNSFIATHQTKDEYMRRGKSYSQFQDYIDAEIAKAQDSLSDEELMYLKQYYGL